MRLCQNFLNTLTFQKSLIVIFYQILHKLWVAEVPDRMDDRHLQFSRALMGSLCLTMMYDIFEAHAQRDATENHSDRAPHDRSQCHLIHRPSFYPHIKRLSE